MRASFLVLSSAVGLVLAACGGATTSTGSTSGEPAASSGGASSTHDSNESTPARTVQNACVGVATTLACDAALDVATADEVFAQLATLTESVDASTKKDSGEKLRPTRDLHATAAIELDIAVFRAAHPICPPEDDAGRPLRGCVESVFTGEQNSTGSPFEIAGPSHARALPAGVTCTASDDDGCSKITITTGTTVRLARASTPYFFLGYFPHFVRVTRACNVPCGAEELRCAASTTCIVASSFCLLCEGKSLPVCACRDACTTNADGSTCGYDTSDDTGTGGTCSAGTCIETVRHGR